jgi:hypothetical protein
MKPGEFVQQFLILLVIVIAAGFVSRFLWDPLLSRLGGGSAGATPMPGNVPG